jgi:hypothetical protein
MMQYLPDSAKDLTIETKHSRGVPVFIFDDHSVALKAWASIRRTSESPLVLLTLDKHTDTHPALAKYGYWEAQKQRRDSEDLISELLSAADWNNLESIDAILPVVKHDEHIATAIELGVLHTAFVLSQDERRPTRSNEYNELFEGPLAHFLHNECELPPRPYHYDRPANGIFNLPNEYPTVGGDEADCERALADAAIESWLLADRLSVLDEMIRSIGYGSLAEAPYILDLDLDYFRTLKSLSPDDSAEFLKLAQGAKAITIAREPKFVEMGRLDSGVDASTNLNAILNLLTVE